MTQNGYHLNQIIRVLNYFVPIVVFVKISNYGERII